MTMRTGAWPPSLLVVRRGLSRRTVSPPTITASDLALICTPAPCSLVHDLTYSKASPLGPSSTLLKLQNPRTCVRLSFFEFYLASNNSAHVAVLLPQVCAGGEGS